MAVANSLISVYRDIKPDQYIEPSQKRSGWHFSMPIIMEGSILTMSRAGTGTAIFSMGLFMASQEKVLACGANLTIFGMALKFIADPATMAVASFAVGLHGQVLRVAIIQAALPQSITSSIFAKEYGLHADVLSTGLSSA